MIVVKVFQNNFEKFIQVIKDCTKPPKYKWNSTDVCMNTNDCFKAHGYGIWSILMKPDGCKCTGNYNHKCNSNYCASDKRACEYLKNKANIKKC